MANLGLIKSLKKTVHDKQIENMIPKGNDNVGSRKELNKHKNSGILKELEELYNIYKMKAGCFDKRMCMKEDFKKSYKLKIQDPRGNKSIGSFEEGLRKSPKK